MYLAGLYIHPWDPCTPPGGGAALDVVAAERLGGGGGPALRRAGHHRPAHEVDGGDLALRRVQLQGPDLRPVEVGVRGHLDDLREDGERSGVLALRGATAQLSLESKH